MTRSPTPPPPDSSDDGQRHVSDEEWKEVVSALQAESSFVAEMTPNEVREALDEQDGWNKPPPPHIGWRSARPGFLVSLVCACLGVLSLIMTAVFFRDAPSFVVFGLVAVVIGAAIGLFFCIPQERSTTTDDGTIF